MSRSFAQTIFILITACLLMTLGSQQLRAQTQGFTSAAEAAPATGNEPASDKSVADINGLVRDSDLHGVQMHRSLNEYTYTLVKTRRTLDPHGKVTNEKVQSFEAYPIEGQHVLVQTSQNGVALTPREVAEERRLAGEELMKAERAAQMRQDEAQKIAESGNTNSTNSTNSSNNSKVRNKTKLPAKANALTNTPLSASPASAPSTPPLPDLGRHLLAGVYVNLGGRYTNILIDLSEFLRSCEFSNPRREHVGKRDAIALSFRPRADVKFPPHVAFISKLTGTIWIDNADKVVMRLEGWPQAKSAGDGQSAAHQGATTPAPDAEPAVIYQQMRLSTGVWVPSLIRMNAGGDAALFNGLNWDVLFEFKDYKRFSTDVGGVELDKPKKN